MKKKASDQTNKICHVHYSVCTWKYYILIPSSHAALVTCSTRCFILQVADVRSGNEVRNTTYGNLQQKPRGHLAWYLEMEFMVDYHSSMRVVYS